MVKVLRSLWILDLLQNVYHCDVGYDNESANRISCEMEAPNKGDKDTSPSRHRKLTGVKEK